MSDVLNPRAVPGGNNPPDFAKLEQERLASEYVGYQNTLEELAELAAALDAEIPDTEDADKTALETGAVIKRLRDLDKRIEETRVVEGEPHLRRKNACDAFFKGLRRMIQGETPQERRVKPGWIDRLQTRINAHQERKERKERERLEQQRLEQERRARLAVEEEERRQAAARKAEQEAREKQEAADRARNADIKAEKQRLADEAAKRAEAEAAAAKAAAVNAEAALDSATDARIGTLTKSSDLVRTRGLTEQGAGVTLTTATESYAHVVARELLDARKLFVYLTDDEVAKALRAYAKATNYSEPMAGAEIGRRRKGVTR